MNLKEIWDSVGVYSMAQDRDRDQWQALVNTEMY